ncbi:MAG: sporulation protein YqfD [Clostridia bacterium]|nr:sporulation protein YqfD [Clostridia bacterium]
MIVVKLFRLLFGFVTFRAAGGFPERFLNLCRAEHLPIWHLRSDSDGLTARTAAADYKRLRPIAAKAGMRLTLLRKRGAPFALRRLRGRQGLLIGAGCVCLLLGLLHGRIWSIELQNETSVPSAEILAAFAQAGVRTGARMAALDEGTVERAAILQLPRIQWTNVNFGGCAAVIAVREATPDSIEDNTNAPANLVAARDGTILLMQPFRGTAAVKRGLPVLKGELLIAGMTENKDGVTRFCRAAGYVTAQTRRRCTVALPQTATLQMQTGLTRQVRLQLFSLTLPAPRGGGFCEVSAPVIRGVTLPFAVRTYTQHTAAAVDYAPTPQEAQLLCALTFFDRCCEEFRWLTVEQAQICADGGGLHGDFLCTENIGACVPMEIAEEPGGE